MITKSNIFENEEKETSQAQEDDASLLLWLAQNHPMETVSLDEITRSHIVLNTQSERKIPKNRAKRVKRRLLAAIERLSDNELIEVHDDEITLSPEGESWVDTDISNNPENRIGLIV